MTPRIFREEAWRKQAAERGVKESEATEGEKRRGKGKNTQDYTLNPLSRRRP